MRADHVVSSQAPQQLPTATMDTPSGVVDAAGDLAAHRGWHYRLLQQQGGPLS